MQNNIPEFQLNRRSFLLSIGAVAASSLLSACVPIPVRPEQEGKARVASNSRIRGLTVADMRDARQAQRVFAAMDRSKSLPASEQMAVLEDKFRQDLAGMPALLSDVMMAEIGSDLAAIVRASIALRHRLNSGPARIEKRSGGVIDIPAMGGVRVSMAGYCMDQRLPAPGQGSLLRFRPAVEFENENLGHIEKAVMRYAQANADKVPHYIMQHIMWGLRDLGTGSNFTSSLAKRPDLLGILDKAAPGSSSRFLQEFNKTEGDRLAREQLHRMMPALATLEKLASGELLNPASSGAAINRHLTSLKSPGGNVPAEAAYSILAPGVYARTGGTGLLAMKAEIVNLSGENFRFDPVEWVAETQLPEQRVAFTGIESADALRTGTPAGGFDVKGFLVDASKDIGTKALGMADAQEAARLAYRLGAADKRMLGKVAYYVSGIPLTALPVLGNVFSMYELISGKDLITGETLNGAERTLAGFGSIPGYGSLVRVAGSAQLATRLLGPALANRNVARSLTSLDKSQWIQDIGNISQMNVTQDGKLWDTSTRIVKELVAA